MKIFPIHYNGRLLERFSFLVFLLILLTLLFSSRPLVLVKSLSMRDNTEFDNRSCAIVANLSLQRTQVSLLL